MTTPTLTVYGADWCGFTKKFQNDYANDIDKYASANVSVVHKECTSADKDECTEKQIRGFPTFVACEGTPNETTLPGYKPTQALIDLALQCGAGR